MSTEKDFISISFKPGDVPETVTVKFTTAFTTHFKEVSKGIFACYIPSYDINYTACSVEDIDKNGAVLIEAFLFHGINNVGATGFFQKLRTLNFSPKSNYWDSFMKNKDKNLLKGEKFECKKIVLNKDFENSQSKVVSISQSLSNVA